MAHIKTPSGAGRWLRWGGLGLAFALFCASPWLSFGQSSPAETASSGSVTRLVETTSQSIVFDINVPAWTMTQRVEGGITFDQLNVPGLTLATTPGQVELPQQYVILGIPADITPTISILEAVGEQVQSGVRLGTVSVVTPDVNYLTLAYPTAAPTLSLVPSSGDAFTPTQLVELVEVGRLRSQAFVKLRVSPFQYQAAQGELRSYTRLRVALTFASLMSPRTNAPVVDEGPFETTLRDLLANYDQARGWRVPPAPKQSKTDAYYAGPRYRIEVSQDGLYALDRTQITDPSFLVEPLNTFQLFEDYNLTPGLEVALETVDQNGNNQFESGDLIRFYGRPPSQDEQRYTGKRVYWLVAGRQPGLRMSTRSGVPVGNPVPADFPTTVHVEENRRYYWNVPTEGGSDTHWYWHYLVHVDPSTPQTRDYPIPLVGLSPVNHTVTLRAKLAALSGNVNINPDHHQKFLFGNDGTNLALDATWDGPRGILLEKTGIPSNLLIPGTNKLTLQIELLPGVVVDAFFTDYFEVDYRQSFVAQSDRLRFTRPVGSSEYQITGFSGTVIGVYDVTDPKAPVRLTNPQITAPGTVRFADGAAGAQNYLAVLLQSPAVLSPDAIAFTTAGPDLRAATNAANYLVITPADFTAAANQLAAYRSATFTTQVVQVQDIYNQFGNAVLDPEAIHDFLAYAVQNWTLAPAYVVAMGDGVYDYRNYLNKPRQNYIPPYTAMVDPYLGETADENYFAAVVGPDIVPDLYFGRLPVNSLAEATTVINKIIAYEAATLGVPAPPESALYITDNYDPGTYAGNFPRLADYQASLLPPSYTIHKVYYGETHSPAAAAKTAFINYVNQGERLVTYIGHSSITQWAEEALFTVSDVNTLANAGKYPVVLDMTCLVGSFQDVDQDSLGESMVRAAGKGSVANWSPTGLGVATGHDRLNRGFSNALFKTGVRRLGPATVAGKAELYSFGTFLDLMHTYGLLGDPATDTGIVPPPPTPTPTPTATYTPVPTRTPTVTPTVSTRQVSGQLSAQARSSKADILVKLEQGATIIQQTVTQSNGAFMLNVPPGDYTITASFPKYLSRKAQITVPTDITPTIMATTILPGGDGNQDGVVGLVDLILVGANYGTGSPPDVPPADPRGDINGDGRINLLDLTMVGANYGRRSTANDPLGWVDTVEAKHKAPDMGKAAPAYAFLDAPTQVKAGEEFVARVRLVGRPDLQGADVTLLFDPARLAVGDATDGQPGAVAPGDVFDAATRFVARNQVESAKGLIHYVVVRLGASAETTASDELFTVHFKARQSGLSGLRMGTVELVSRDSPVLIER
ncbi:MAG: hypothetical protein KIT87_26940 [Anaerolineae bacterium]|nr:hypothetical protein [Anaerolineae bacterium]